ncbi:MAG: hypothetical protein IJN43_13135 [Ruminococcus sp.]|nr:hypothetical protein [Ruminococcus sp.]
MKIYSGEQLDSTTGLYYLRARYMNPTTGTFITQDTYQGTIFDPTSKIAEWLESFDWSSVYVPDNKK